MANSGLQLPPCVTVPAWGGGRWRGVGTYCGTPGASTKAQSWFGVGKGSLDNTPPQAHQAPLAGQAHLGRHLGGLLQRLLGRI